MFSKVLLFAFFVIGVQSRYILLEEYPLIEDVQFEPEYHVPRVRRQAQGSISATSDGDVQLSMKQPLAGNEDRTLSAIGSTSSKSTSGGFMLETAKGNSLAVTKENIPAFGSKLRADANMNLFKNDNHDLNANAFVARNMPKPEFQAPNFNTYGGGLDYTYKEKIGAGLSAARTDFLDQTNVSAFGKYNIFKNPSHSLDLNAGVARTFTPHFSTSWQPFAGMTYRF